MIFDIDCFWIILLSLCFFESIGFYFINSLKILNNYICCIEIIDIFCMLQLSFLQRGFGFGFEIWKCFCWNILIIQYKIKKNVINHPYSQVRIHCLFFPQTKVFKSKPISFWVKQFLHFGYCLIPYSIFNIQ